MRYKIQQYYLTILYLFTIFDNISIFILACIELWFDIILIRYMLLLLILHTVMNQNRNIEDDPIKISILISSLSPKIRKTLLIRIV